MPPTSLTITCTTFESNPAAGDLRNRLLQREARQKQKLEQFCITHFLSELAGRQLF